MKRSLREQREIALRAAWGLLKRLGRSPEECSVKDAETVLDELARKDKELIASQWYLASVEDSENQWKMFAREWNARCKQTKADNAFLVQYGAMKHV